MYERLKKVAIGGSAVALLGVGAMSGQAFAQDATATPSASTSAITTAGSTSAQDAADADYQAFIDGLEAVPGSYINQQQSFANEYAMGIDAVQTYDEDGARRKRWIRLLYKGSTQARIIAQAPSVEEYERLRPLFAPCMTTFMVAARS